MIILLLPFELIGGGLEEIGWRFLLQPELEKRTNFMVATVITGIIWAVWHLPLFYMTGTNQYSWSFFAFAILVMGMSFILTAFYKISNSILPCILFHTLWNAIGDTIAITMDIDATVVVSVMLLVISFIMLQLNGKMSQGLRQR